MHAETGGRPAELFRFRRELLAARPGARAVAAAAEGLGRIDIQRSQIMAAAM